MEEFNNGVNSAQNTRFKWKDAKKLQSYIADTGENMANTSLELGKGADTNQKTNSTAVGTSAFASSANTTAIGCNAKAYGADSTVVGANAMAYNTSSTGNVVIGKDATSSGNNGIVIGNGATTASSADGSISVGYKASSYGNGVAIGANASANNGAVNIGCAGSVASKSVALGGKVSTYTLPGLQTQLFAIVATSQGSTTVPSGCQGIVISPAGTISIVAAGGSIPWQAGGIAFLVRLGSI